MEKLIRIFALVALLGIAGCATLPLDSALEKPVSMTDMKGDQVKTFLVQKQAIWLFWGAIPVSVPKVDEVVGTEAASHSGVQNLKVTTEYTFINFLLGAITQGAIYSQTVTIEGQVYD